MVKSGRQVFVQNETCAWRIQLVLCCLGSMGCLGSLVLTSGCQDSGPTTYAVTGTITYQGKPLETGLVTFESPSYRPAASPIDSEGRYRLRTIEGQHAVGVVANRRVKEKGFEGLPEYEPIIPDRFNYPASSGIKVTVEKLSENKIDIKLE